VITGFCCCCYLELLRNDSLQLFVLSLKILLFGVKCELSKGKRNLHEVDKSTKNISQ